MEKLYDFDLWLLGKILRVLWTEGNQKNAILLKLKPNILFEVMTKMLKIRYFRHMTRKHQSMEK